MSSILNWGMGGLNHLDRGLSSLWCRWCRISSIHRPRCSDFAECSKWICKLFMEANCRFGGELGCSAQQQHLARLLGGCCLADVAWRRLLRQRVWYDGSFGMRCDLARLTNLRCEILASPAPQPSARVFGKVAWQRVLGTDAWQGCLAQEFGWRAGHR